MLADVAHFNHVFFYTGVFSTAILLIKAFIPFDFGSEVSGDFNSMVDSDASFNLLSLESILSFLMCFGWMGYYNLHYLNNPIKTTLIISLVCGAIGMLFFAFMFSLIKKMEFVPKSDLKDLVGKSGKSYTKFNPLSKGQIQIEFNNGLKTLDAVNNSDCEIASFELIKVVKVEDDVIYIEKM